MSYSAKWLGLSVLAIAVLAAALPRSARAQAGLPPMGEEYRPSGYPEGFTNNLYPATELRAVPLARARAVAARAEYRANANALTNAVEDVKRKYKHSAELAEAQAEERSAWQELNEAKDAALAKVKSDPNYQAAVLLRKRLDAKLQAAREAGQQEVAGTKVSEVQSIENLLATATVKLSYAMTVSAMEAAAISADPAVRDSRERLVRAGDRLRVLQVRFDEAVRADENVLAARANLQSSRTMALAAEAFYIEARNNRDWATDYAFYLRERPQPVYYPPVFGGGYYGGFGYGGGGFGYPQGWTGGVSAPAR